MALYAPSKGNTRHLQPLSEVFAPIFPSVFVIRVENTRQAPTCTAWSGAKLARPRASLTQRTTRTKASPGGRTRWWCTCKILKNTSLVRTGRIHLTYSILCWYNMLYAHFDKLWATERMRGLFHLVLGDAGVDVLWVVSAERACPHKCGFHRWLVRIC